MSRRLNYFTFKSIQNDRSFTSLQVLNLLERARRSPDYVQYRRSLNQLTSRDYKFNNVSVVDPDVFVIGRPVRNRRLARPRFRVSRELSPMNLIVVNE